MEANRKAPLARYKGYGTFSSADVEFQDAFDIQIQANGEISGNLTSGNATVHLNSVFDHEWKINGEIEDGILVAEHASFTRFNRNGFSFILPSFTVRQSHSWPEGTYEYQLANCVFSIGSHVTTNSKGGAAWNAIEVEAYGCQFRIQKVTDYDAVIEDSRASESAAITATLQIKGAISVQEADQFASLMCALLAFSTKNSTKYISRRSADGGKLVTEYFRPLLYPSRTGWSLLSDFPRKGQVPLHEFLTGALQQIRELDEKLDFSTIVSWLIDAEFSASLQPKFLLMFAAIERLRSRMSKGQPTGHLIADNFIQAIDGSLGDDLMNRIMADFPDMSSENQSVLRKNLKTLDRPPIAASLDLLCQNFGVIASTKKMAHLRSRLMHAGTLGEFSFQPALSLYKELSHVLDVCLLKALGYSGSYTHWANEWEERPVTETLDLRQSE